MYEIFENAMWKLIRWMIMLGTVFAVAGMAKAQVEAQQLVVVLGAGVGMAFAFPWFIREVATEEEEWDE